MHHVVFLLVLIQKIDAGRDRHVVAPLLETELGARRADSLDSIIGDSLDDAVLSAGCSIGACRAVWLLSPVAAAKVVGCLVNRVLA